MRHERTPAPASPRAAGAASYPKVGPVHHRRDLHAELLSAGSTVDILLELSNPGRWMLRCHIAEHIEAGMHAVLVFETATAK